MAFHTTITEEGLCWRTGLPVSAFAILVLSLLLTAVPPSHAAATHAEQEGHHGVNAFTNYHNASGMGPRIDPAAWVQVSCKGLRFNHPISQSGRLLVSHREFAVE